MKTQMKFQKIMCLVSVLAGALSLIYCFIYCTGALSNISLSVSQEGGNPVYTPGFEGPGQLYIDIQPFNNTLMILSIAMIVAGALLYVVACNSRRNYYISNYVVIGVVSAFDIAVSLYIMITNGIFLGRFNALMGDPAVIAKYEEVAAGNKAIECVTSNWTFVVGFVVYPIIIIAAVGLILNLLWKIKLMNGEKALLAASAVEDEEAEDTAEAEVVAEEAVEAGEQGAANEVAE